MLVEALVLAKLSGTQKLLCSLGINPVFSQCLFLLWGIGRLGRTAFLFSITIYFTVQPERQISFLHPIHCSKHYVDTEQKDSPYSFQIKQIYMSNIDALSYLWIGHFIYWVCDMWIASKSHFLLFNCLSFVIDNEQSVHKYSCWHEKNHTYKEGNCECDSHMMLKQIHITVREITDAKLRFLHNWEDEVLSSQISLKED